MNEQQMREILTRHGIQLVVLHLNTPAGKRHDAAKTARQYQTLAGVSDGRIRHMHVPIPADNPASSSVVFKKLSHTLSATLVRKLQEVEERLPPARPQAASFTNEEERLAYIADCLGYAAHLDFLGQERDTVAPRLVEAWTTDKDLVRLSESGEMTETVSVTVLLNKRQLNSLAVQLEHVLESARLHRDESRGFFNRIISLAAQTVRDPSQLQSGEASTSLAEMGALPEFLEGLPYISKVMGMTAAGWTAMNSEEQDSFILELESKLQLYRSFDNDTANWELFGSGDPQEALYRVPLSALP
jgi:serine/threonine-protein kinase PpkA